MVKKGWLGFVLIFLSACVQAQPISSLSAFKDSAFDQAYLKSYPSQVLHAIKMPARFQTKDWVAAGVAASVFVGIYLHDEEIYTVIQRIGGTGEPKKLAWTDAFGNGLVALPTLAAMFLINDRGKNLRAREAALSGLQAFVIGAGSAFAAKHLTHRPRPDQLFDARDWHGPFQSFSYDAFPSGHSLRAFATATVIAGYYPDQPLIGLLSFTLAGLTAVGRLESGAHWPSDVFAGAAIGYALGRSIIHFNQNKMKNVQLTMDGNTVGLRLVF
ncbi:MAG: phosphatase PAP2 family protein [Bacteroidales bacterium]|nr:phosphatase PAP2 family protein [Bacteroidales bacterium]